MPLELETPTTSLPRNGSIVVGLINNMPSGALRATEHQFAALLAAAAGPLTVRLRLSYLSEVPREAEVLESLGARYWRLEALLDDPPDALIVTGTEPRAPTLEQEPYWTRLRELLDWAQTHTLSSIWSCLAAHAAVQALDGIRRRRLPQKRFGVFAHERSEGIALLEGLDGALLTPHSRWNDLPENELRAAGYVIASASAHSGVDVFLRQERSLLVGFQGHPEYQAETLFKEFRRDVGRFLRGEQALWPTLPHDYFSTSAIQTLEAFRRRAESLRDPALLGKFPEQALTTTLDAPWQSAAVRIYHNWLAHLAKARLAAHGRR